MKQDISTFLTESFIDFAGKEHKIVACALSQSPEGDDRMMVGWVDDNDVMNPNENLYHEVYRLVTIGFAVCNPEDQYDEEKGKKLAYTKAANMETLPRIYTPNKGVITKELVNTFLRQQVSFVIENPELIIKGYNEAKKAYEEGQAAKDAIDKFSEEEKKVFDLAVKGFDFSKYVQLAKTYVKHILKNE